jgi:hypothetical protein
MLDNSSMRQAHTPQKTDFDHSPTSIALNRTMNPSENINSPETADEQKAEALRIVKRLAALIEEHRQAALPLGIKLAATELCK